MRWESIFNVFTRQIFTLGGKPVSLLILVQFILLIVAVILLARLTRRVLRERLLGHTHLDPGLQDAIARMTSYAVVVIGGIIGLQTLGFELTSLTVLAGAFGVGLGFGLRNIIENFVSGLIILGERPIQLGHRIEVGDAAGRVVQIGARSTSVLTNDNIRIIIPNSELITGRVVNWSYAEHIVRLRIRVGVSYQSDVQLVEKLLLEVAAENTSVIKTPAPAVVFLEFGESSLNFELRVWTRELLDHPGRLISQLNFAIWGKFREHNIEIPYPQRDLYLKEPVYVELKRSNGMA
jgi:small-conductance mechanosensitive channel